MRHSLYFKGIKKTEAIEEYADKKIQSLGKLIKDNTAIVNIELSKITAHHKQGDVFRAEIKISSLGKEFYVASEKDDLYAAIDEMRDEISQELVKFKDKRETVFLRGARTVKNIIKGLDPRDYESWRVSKAWKKWRNKSE